MKPMGQLIIGGLLLAICSSPVFAEAYGSGWYGEIQATYGHEDNISHTYKSDGNDDDIATVSIGGGYSQKLGDNAQLILSSYLIATRHDEYDALDSIAFSLGADYTIQPRTGYDSPWYNVNIRATNLNFEDSDPREGVLVQAEFSYNKRLTSLLTGHLGYRYRDFIFVGKSGAEETNDDAFDTDSQEIFFAADYQLRRQVFLFGEYAYRHGDIVSTVTGGGVVAAGAYDAETLDPTFDPPCERRCWPGYAYRTRGDTHLVTLGVTFPVHVVNVDVAASYFDAEGDNGKKYDDWVVKIGMLWNF